MVEYERYKKRIQELQDLEAERAGDEGKERAGSANMVVEDEQEDDYEEDVVN